MKCAVCVQRANIEQTCLYTKLEFHLIMIFWCLKCDGTHCICTSSPAFDSQSNTGTRRVHFQLNTWHWALSLNSKILHFVLHGTVANPPSCISQERPLLELPVVMQFCSHAWMWWLCCRRSADRQPCRPARTL